MKNLPLVASFYTFQKLSSLSGKFPYCLESFKTVWKVSRLSRNFPDCPGTFQTVQKLSRISGHFPDCPDTLQIVQKLSRLSRNIPDYPETYAMFLGTMLYAQKLSGRAQTFRSAMPIRRRGFSASATYLPYRTPSRSNPRDL